MITSLTIIAIITLFIIAIISPHTAGKIERKTNQQSDRLKRLSNWLWDPLAWWAHGSIELIRRLLSKAVETGKKTRRRL